MFRTALYYYLIGFVLFILLRYGLGLDGLYGQDSYEYYRYTNALHLFITTTVPASDYFWPVYYPLLGSILKFVIPNTSFALQLISAFSFITTAIYIKKTISILHPSNNLVVRNYIILFFVASPMVFRMAFLVMSDMLALLWVVLCMYHSLKYYKFLTIKNLYLATLFGLLAFFTRYASIVALFPFGLWLLKTTFTKKKFLFHWLGMGLLAIVIMLPHYYFKSQNPIGFLNHDWLQDWSIGNMFKNSFTTVDGNSHHFFLNCIYAFSNAFHPRYFFLGSLLLLIAIKQKIKLDYFWILCSSYILYSLFLAGIPFQNSRFLLLSFPVLLILLFPAFEYLSALSFCKKHKNPILITLFLFNTALCLYGLKPILERTFFEKKIVAELKEYQNNQLYSFDIDIALQGRGLQFDYKNLWIEEYTTFQENALVLFHPTKFLVQWEGKNPIKNWNNLNKNYHLELVKNCSNGWNLYKIKTKIE